MDKDEKISKPKNIKKNSLITIIFWALPFIIILIIIGAVFIGRLSIIIKAPNQLVITHTNICGGDIVERYNKILESESIEEYNNSFKTLIVEIGSKADYNKDPNCSYILYNYYLYIEDADKAGQNLDNLKLQNGRGDYLNGNISGVQGIEWLDRKLKLFKDNGVRFSIFNTNDAG